MEAIKNNKTILKNISLFFRLLAAIFISITYTGVGSVFAQSDTSSSEALPNEALKSVFQQIKNEVKGNDTLSSILMIVGVILIVCVAVFLSFRSSGTDNKKATLKNTAPKKA